MISQKTLKLYVYVDGVNDVPFYGSDAGEYEEFILSNGEQFILSNGFVFNVRNVNEQVEIGNFRFDAKRMGGAPTITFTLMYEDCLDNFWSENVYATFNGEKYFLKQTPTSSLSNEDARYKHDVELISERVALDNVYFFDAVKNSAENNDAVSNSATFAFFGNIVDFKNKLNASLRYADMQTVDGDGVVSGWEVVVDDNITSEEKFISFDNAFFSNAIQESYNTFKIPYYFKGKKIHFGYTDNTIAEEFSYGVDDALLSITKSNANYKVVNRVTGTGSSDNIPFYYPNNSPKGELKAECSNEALSVKVLDFEKFSNSIGIDDSVTYRNAACELSSVKAAHSSFKSLDEWFSEGFYDAVENINLTLKLNASSVGRKTVRVGVEVKNIRDGKDVLVEGADYSVQWALMTSTYGEPIKTWMARETSSTVELAKEGVNDVYLRCSIRFVDAKKAPLPSTLHRADLKISLSLEDNEGWEYKERMYGIEDFGLAIEKGTPTSGDTITQRLVKYVNTSNVLLPPKYRETDGQQRFYNATNDTYTDDNGETIVFTNPFVEGHPKEHIITVEDIKPTIKEKRNASNLRIDMFSEFAYDDGDNDETYIDEEDGKTYFKHPYFYGKLRIMDFNLFDHANENQPMTISFTSGDAGACNFEIGATEEYPQMNPVQVDANGNLLRDENGMVLSGIENQQPEVTTLQDRQQDTSKYEVWIALKKEEETYGMLMPQTLLRPKACTSATANDGDTFVILGINLPQSYITAAEQKLEKEIIKYMYENNVEKFKFSIKFSRIYFEENPDVLELLDENSRIYVWYNGVRYTLYVTSMSYYMESDGVLPDITVELDDTLSLTQNALQNAISQVKADVGNALGSIDITALATPYFIRKDQDDEANGVVNFKKGIKFGEGGKVTMYDDNSAKLTIEYLEVTKKATFTSLEIQEKTHVGGQILISPAAMTCGEVEELENAYRCYFQTKGQDGNDEIFNQFVVRDQAICQTFNAWGSRYYWRLVVGVGEDYIDLSKTDCDKESDIPMAGDKIIQLGHRNDKSRQAAQVLSAHGETSPSTIMYNGIDNFSLADKEVTGTLWNPATQEPQMYCYGNFFFGNRTKDENGEFVSDFITFQPKKDNPEEKKLFINADVQFGGGSKGLSDLSEWQELQGEVSDAIDGVKKSVQEVQDQIDGVVENWNGEGAPLLTTEPTKSWVEKSDGELIAHINDTYINIEKYKDDATTPTAGQAWRWCQCTEDDVETESITLSGYIGAPTMGVNIGTLPSRLNYTSNVRVYKDKELLGTVSISSLGNSATINGLQIITTTSGLVSIMDTTPDGANIGNIDVEFEYYDYIQVKDNEDNVLNLHWHPIADSDAVRALKDAAEATKIASEASRLNLLANSAEVLSWESEYTHIRIPLPIRVNAGEKYTFKCEKSMLLTGTHTGYQVKLDAKDDDSAALTPWYSVDFGENNVVVMEVNDGVSDSVAMLTIFKQSYPDSFENKARFQNVSLVKGTAAMPMWQDYQGDNGLKNLINVKSDETIILTNDYIAELTINSGEQYTFRADNISDSGSHIVGISDFETIWFTDTFSLVNGSNTYYVLTVKEGVSKQKAYLHIWSSTSGQITLTRPTLVKGTRPMMTWKQNTDYLTNAFKNGSTKISGGLTMTQAVMVEDESGVVKGMLNGSNYAKDSTHGRLIVAAGSSGATEPQLAAATTRIYEKGKIISKDVDLEGKITATSGSFTGSITATSFATSGFAFGNAKIDSIGYHITNSVIDKGVHIEPGYIEVGTAMRGSLGSNRMTSSALIMGTGMIEGMRPKTRILNGGTLSSSDHTIIVTSENATISLPSSPVEGMEFRIYKRSNSGALGIDGNGNSIYNMGDGTIGTGFVSASPNMIDIVWDGTYWLAN